MNDPTTAGYFATPAEIDGMVRNLCAYALSEPDPMQRYVELTQQQVLFEGMVEAIRRERGRALADLLVAGMPAAQVAAKTNLATEPKVRKLISTAGEADRVKAATRPAKGAKAAKAAKPKKEPAPLPPHLATPSGKRVLTPADLEALGVAPKKRVAKKATPRKAGPPKAAPETAGLETAAPETAAPGKAAQKSAS